jgi:hypothetical protein
MNIGPSLSTLQTVQSDLSKMPARIMDSMHNPESTDAVEKVFTDMKIGENTFAANIKTIRTISTVEDMLLNELRK